VRESVKSKSLFLVSTLLVFILACQALSPIEEQPKPPITDDLPTQTATVAEPTKPPNTVTPTPLPITIRVRMDDNLQNGEINIEVLEGDYQLVYGTTLRAGSKIWEEEQYLVFPVGLAIEVGPAGLTLKGNNYPAGTLLFVDKEDHLMVVGNADTPTTGKPTSEMFRDDFTEGLQAGWEWQNEDPSRWKITSEGWLQIVGEDDSVLAAGTQSNLLCRDAPSGDIQISVHVYADPNADFQQATLYLYQDGDNFVAINRGYCSPCDTGGNGIYMENKVAGNWTAYNLKNQDPDVFLRLIRRANAITGYYANEADEWNVLGEFDNPLEDPKICLGVTNADAEGIDADLVGEFDYIEVTQQ
jgi:hypothetical protein